MSDVLRHVSNSSEALIARALFRAYLEGDRGSAEHLVAAEMVFTSPQDDHIDRAAYFERCFPTASRLARQEVLAVADARPGSVFLLYEYELLTGEVHRNAEYLTVRKGQVVEVQVFFGGRAH